MRCLTMLVGLIALLALVVQAEAATIFYKPGKDSEKQTLTKVKIVSISKGVILVERDGGKRSIPLSQLVEYSDSDITGGDLFEDNSADYAISIMRVAMPKRGVAKTGSRQGSAPVAECEIEYLISRKSEEGKDIDRIKAPYFYLFVLSESGDEYNEPHIFRYYYPSDAKPGGSDVFDEARILTAVQSMKRRTINFNHSGLSTPKKAGLGLGEREIKIKLTRIGDRKIVAYHLEVWGKSGKIAEKDWNEPEYARDKKWWLRY